MVSLVPFLVLLLTAVLVVVLCQRVRFPYTVALVLLGFVVGLLSVPLPFLDATPALHALFSTNVFFYVLLPPIVFEAAIHVNYRFLRSRAPLILFLVFVGVIFTTFFTGYLVSLAIGLPLGAAVLLAAILSPTDPIAVVSLLRRVKVPKELSTIIESESLLNDATGVIIFLIVVAYLQGHGLSFPALTGAFFLLTFGGAAVGLAIAAGVYLLHRQINDASVETALSVAVAYGSFLLASQIGASGIVATAIAGIAMGTYVVPRAMEPDVRQAVTTFWSVAVYLVNSVVFLAMGLLVGISELRGFLPTILLVLGLLFLGRAIFVYAERPLARALGRHDRRLPVAWLNVVTFAGVRGAIPVVLALSLLGTPLPYPSSVVATIVGVAIGVAFLSILLGNLVSELYVRARFPVEPPAAPAPNSVD